MEQNIQTLHRDGLVQLLSLGLGLGIKLATLRLLKVLTTVSLLGQRLHRSNFIKLVIAETFLSNVTYRSNCMKKEMVEKVTNVLFRLNIY